MPIPSPHSVSHSIITELQSILVTVYRHFGRKTLWH